MKDNTLPELQDRIDMARFLLLDYLDGILRNVLVQMQRIQTTGHMNLCWIITLHLKVSYGLLYMTVGAALV